LVFTVPAALVGFFGSALPEAWRGLAKLAMVITLFALPFEGMLGRLIELSKRSRAARRGT
jgi:hypothetical protein